MRRTSCFIPYLLLGLAVSSLCSSAIGSQGKERPEGLQARFRDWSDQRLSDRLDELLSSNNFRRKPAYEACLSEIVRRGGERWASVLRSRRDALMEREFDLYGDAADLVPGSYFNLELLTALRRVEGKSDPLQIFVELPNNEIAATPLSLPQLRVSIKNVDGAQQEVGFTFGGNYRSGRQARWRLAVVDTEGRWVPRRAQHGLITGGGLYERGVLRHGESWETVIDARRFIATPLPGRYTLQVLYHDTRTIADLKDISGLIVSKSAEIPFVVEPAVIELTEAERRAAEKWIAEIDADEQVKVVAGTYGEWAHHFLPPDSPQGKLLEMGLKSVPSLIESLQEDTRRAEKRAWILSLLFSVTGEHDPRRGSILGSYEKLEGPWEVLGGKPGEEGSRGIGFAARGSSSGGRIDAKSQEELSAKWIDWLETVQVITTANE